MDLSIHRSSLQNLSTNMGSRTSQVASNVHNLMETIKDIMKRNKIQNSDMYMSMLAYRSTPLENG